VVPTRLGNAIRRLEEYGYDRYRLDSQTLWYELTAVASDDARKQVDQARTTVDFLVGTLYGNVLVAACALAAIGSGARHPWLLATYALALIVAATSWYHIAVKATDDWAAAVRALVNLGRGPLAAALGLRMPPAIGIERKMWAAVSRLSARPYDTKTSEIDQYRDASQ
jgi:hypothetical protein